MIFYFLSRVFSSILTYLYPAYISYKLLSTRPTPLPLLERALKYWCVLGTFTFFEYSGAELLISWLPLYGIIKLLILSYLVLPQTGGSTHVYDQLLEPWFASHETEVDGALEELRKNVYEFIQTKLRTLWEFLLNSTVLGQAFPAAGTPAAQAQPSVQPPTMADPVSGPAQLAAGFWHSYGPSVLATGAAIYRQLAPTNAPGQARQSTVTGYDVGLEDRPVSSRMSTSQSILERRRQLEAELAALGADEASARASGSGSGNAPPFPIPQIPGMPIPSMFGAASSSSASTPSAVSSASSLPTSHTRSLRERTTSIAGPGGRFEEINPNDLDEHEDDVGHEYPGMPSTSSRTSWFGWGSGGGSGGGGYERVKSD